jgi:predicted membrane protein
MSDQKNQGRIFWGLLLIVLGGLFLFAQLDWWDVGQVVGRYWPVIFILLGISMLISNNFKDVGAGVFFILFGTFFLLVKWRVLHAAGRFLWPVAIICAGLWILLRAAWRPDKKKIPEMTGTAGDDLDIHQVFSGTARKVESKDFKGGKADVVFGSAEIDLRGAKLSGGQATLVLSAVFGGIEIFVPREWQVVLEGTPVLGSIESHKATVPDGEKTGTLHIKGSAVFGSIEVKE